MKKVMQWLMLSCKKATELIEKNLLIKLSFKEKIQLQLHKSMCSACTAYGKQSKRIDNLFQHHIQDEGNNLSGVPVNEGLKKKIMDKLPEN